MDAHANPYRAPSSAVGDPASRAAVELTWARAAKIWWSLFWRTVLLGALAGGVCGGILAGILTASGTPPQVIKMVARLAGAIVTVPIGIWAVRSVLQSAWSDFRIVLVGDPDEHPRTPMS
jgi:hypothetical protein